MGQRVAHLSEAKNCQHVYSIQFTCCSSSFSLSVCAWLGFIIVYMQILSKFPVLTLLLLVQLLALLLIAIVLKADNGSRRVASGHWSTVPCP